MAGKRGRKSKKVDEVKILGPGTPVKYALSSVEEDIEIANKELKAVKPVKNIDDVSLDQLCNAYIKRFDAVTKQTDRGVAMSLLHRDLEQDLIDMGLIKKPVLRRIKDFFSNLFK